jgi:hypothetical protein
VFACPKRARLPADVDGVSRVDQLAKEVLTWLNEHGEFVKSASSNAPGEKTS